MWKLTPAKVLTAVEEGMPLEELGDFLAARGGKPLPQTVRVFLDDMKSRAGQLRDLGLARMIECADPALARQLAGDPQLREHCRLAGERWLVFRAEDEAAVRRSACGGWDLSCRRARLTGGRTPKAAAGARTTSSSRTAIAAPGLLKRIVRRWSLSQNDSRPLCLPFVCRRTRRPCCTKKTHAYPA